MEEKSLQDRVMQFEDELNQDPEFKAAYENLKAVYRKKLEEKIPNLENEPEFEDLNDSRYEAMKSLDPDEYVIVDFLWLNA